VGQPGPPRTAVCYGRVSSHLPQYSPVVGLFAFDFFNPSLTPPPPKLVFLQFNRLVYLVFLFPRFPSLFFVPSPLSIECVAWGVVRCSPRHQLEMFAWFIPFPLFVRIFFVILPFWVFRIFDVVDLPRPSFERVS